MSHVTPVCLAAANVRRWSTQSLGGRLMETTRTLLTTCLRPWFPKIHAKVQRSKTVKFIEQEDVDFAQRCKERVSTYLHSLRAILQDDEMHHRTGGSRIPDDLLILARDVIGQSVVFIELCDELIEASKVPYLSSLPANAAGPPSTSTPRTSNNRRCGTPTGSRRAATTQLFQGASPPRYSTLLEHWDDDGYAPRRDEEKPIGFFIQREASNFSETSRPKIAPRAQTPTMSSSSSPASALSPTQNTQQRLSAGGSGDRLQRRHWMHDHLPPNDLDPVDMITSNRDSISPAMTPSPRRIITALPSKNKDAVRRSSSPAAHAARRSPPSIATAALVQQQHGRDEEDPGEDVRSQYLDVRKQHHQQRTSPSPPRTSSVEYNNNGSHSSSKRRVYYKSLAVPIDYLSDPRRLSPRQRTTVEAAVRAIVNRPGLSDEDRMWLVSTMRRLRIDDELSMPH